MQKIQSIWASLQSLLAAREVRAWLRSKSLESIHRKAEWLEAQCYWLHLTSCTEAELSTVFPPGGVQPC